MKAPEIMNVPVMVFEDGVLPQPDEFHSKFVIPSSRQIHQGLEVHFNWHAVWNHLGKTEAGKLGLSTKTVVSLDIYDEALVFCANENISATIVFVDMSMSYLDEPIPLTRSTAAHKILVGRVEEFISLCNEISPAAGKSLESVLRFLSSNNRHGILLAWALITNKKLRDSDIWLASDAVETDIVVPLLNRLAKREARSVGVFDATGPVAKGGTELVVSRFRRAVEKFSARYAGIENRLWPEASKKWFAAEDPPTEMPHQFAHLTEEHRNAYTSLVSEYIRLLTGRAAVPSDLPISDGLHETLKRLVGGDSRAYSDGKPKMPGLGSILLLLAAAEKDAQCVPAPKDDWFLAATFQAPALTGILPSSYSSRATRNALLALQALFQRLVVPAIHRPTSVTTVASTSWNISGGTLFLWIDFDIDSIKPGGGKESGLLEKLFNRPWRSSYGGDVTEAYRAFREAFSITGETRLALTIYPISVAGKQLTRFEFRAHI